MAIDRDANIHGCMEMFGAAIRLAIFDFKAVHKYHKRMEKERIRLCKTKVHMRQTLKGKEQKLIQALHHYDSARHFLFSSDSLEEFINNSGMFLNIEYVRKVALDKSKGMYLKKETRGVTHNLQKDFEEDNE